MKVIILLAFGLVALVNAMDKDEAKDMFRNMAQDCKEQEKAKDDDIEMMINEKYPESKEGKCLMACMYEQFGLVQEKKFSKEGFMSLASMAAGDDQEKMKNAELIAGICQDISHENRCEQAVMIGKCMEKEARDRNMKME